MLRRCQSLLNSYTQRHYSDACAVNTWRTWKASRPRIGQKPVYHPFPWVAQDRNTVIRYVGKKRRSLGLMDESTDRFGRDAIWLLRHGAAKSGLEVRPDGYVRVRDALSVPMFRAMHMQTFIQLIKNNSIHFQLAYEPDGEDLDTKIPWVRALREHSIPGVDHRLKRINCHRTFPTAVYLTSLTHWECIRTHGISPAADGFIRLWTTLKPINLESTAGPTRPLVPEAIISVYICIQKALSSGIKLYRSRQGGEILTKGDRNGVLAPDLFKMASKVKMEKEVLMEEGSS